MYTDLVQIHTHLPYQNPDSSLCTDCTLNADNILTPAIVCVCLSTVHNKEFEGVKESDSSTDRAQRPPEVSAESVVLSPADGADPGNMGVTL